MAGAVHTRTSPSSAHRSGSRRLDSLSPLPLHTVPPAFARLLALQRSVGNRGVSRRMSLRAPMVALIRRSEDDSDDENAGSSFVEGVGGLVDDAIETGSQLVEDSGVAENVTETGSALVETAGAVVDNVIETGSQVVTGAVEGVSDLANGAGGAGLVPPTPDPDATADDILALQQQLAGLGFATPLTGVFDAATALAVAAFQQLAGLAAEDGEGDEETDDDGDDPSGLNAIGPKDPFRRGRSGGTENACKPFATKALAEETRDELGIVLAASVTPLFGSAVASLWDQYLNGGAAPQQISNPGIIDAFATTGVTTDVMEKVADAAQASLESQPQLPDGIRPLDQVVAPGRLLALADDLVFTNPVSTAGHIAGGIGNQAGSLGAKPSFINDSRAINGAAEIKTLPDKRRQVTVRPRVTVVDTIDFCPGDTGSGLEENLTVPLSRCEATGVSGDVPFTVTFSPEEVERTAGGGPGEEPPIPGPF
ncbi:MAG: hypothetical protein QOF73_2615 [Thermomicrobiales bacterium]|nr:hypothetical protein [Thermomicrobiales bacterium]